MGVPGSPAPSLAPIFLCILHDSLTNLIQCFSKIADKKYCITHLLKIRCWLFDMKYLLILFVGCFLDFGKGLSNLANSKCEYSIDKHIFQQEWSHGTYDLSQFLDNLKEQESLLLAEECILRTYAFTEFSDLVYSRICNRTEFEEKCIADNPTCRPESM